MSMNEISRWLTAMGNNLFCRILWRARVRVLVLSATFNNISVISWRSVLLLEETGVYEEYHWPATSHWQTLSHEVVSSTTRHERIQTHNFSGYRHWLDR